ncbi:MAG: bacteriohemerythrin [Campylobacteraceae bacterium]|jgi:hemerythrin|nr:bacteriohemerythrin [Campylobacteraceae bacterium]
MAYWNWQRSYELGISVIDNQHKRLVQYINELCAALTTKERRKIASVLAGITEYTTLHFAFEERLMEEAGYEKIESHKKTHAAFVATINRYKKAFEEGYDISGQLMAELQIWLTYHISNDDMDYRNCVKKILANKTLRNIKDRAETKRKSWFKTLFG